MASDAGPVRGATLGGYEILFELKSGGMGEVLLARRCGPSGFERLVAIKTMRSELRGRDELRRMFLDEAQLLARLSHPGIAHIHDFGDDRGVLYLAMEYVAGVRFRDLVEAAPLPPAVAARVMAEVCRALHAAHELTDLAGHPLAVVHRDVSPDNLMLTFDGQVKVLDFGIALMRGRQAPVTAYGTIKGKPPYLSPEQIKNQAVDRRTDLFAASAVLHELLTGAQLFGGDSVYAIARAIEHDEVAPPSRAVGPLPAGLDDAVMRGLDRDPDRRWQSAEELALALDRVAAAAGGESLVAYAARHLGDEARRHRDWLRSVLAPSEDVAPPRTGRASGVMTARGPAMAEVLDPDGETFPGDQPAPRRGEPRRRPRRRAWIAAAALGSVAAAVGGVGWWQHEQGTRPPPVAAARADGPTSLAGGAAAKPGATLSRPPSTTPSKGPPGATASVSEATETTPPGGASSGPPSSSDTGARPAGARDPVEAPAAQAAPRSGPAASPERHASRRPADRRGPGSRAARGSRAALGDRSPTPPEPALVEPIGAGTITVVTRAGAPWAKVFIDGEYVDDTPLMKRSIPAGDHTVVLRDAATRQERDSRRVHVGAGQHVEVVER